MHYYTEVALFWHNHEYYFHKQCQVPRPEINKHNPGPLLPDYIFYFLSCNSFFRDTFPDASIYPLKSEGIIQIQSMKTQQMLWNNLDGPE